VAYNIRIIRPTGGEQISDAEWRAAAAKIPTVRLVSGDLVGRNPHTAEVITIKGSGADAEVQLSTGEWLPAVRWFPKMGYLQVPGTLFLAKKYPEVRDAVFQIAKFLGAVVRGGRGDVYDERSPVVKPTSARSRTSKVNESANVIAGPWGKIR
jgi:hypothetical protein